MSSATVLTPKAQDVVAIFLNWQRAVSTGNMDAFRRLYAEHALLFTPLSAEPIQGRNAIGAYESALHTAFPDATLIARKPVVEKDMVAVEWEYGGKNTGPITTPMRVIEPTGQWMKIFGASFLHIQGGLITEERRYYDVRSLYHQLGLQ